jgi:hypothetical protein
VMLVPSGSGEPVEKCYSPLGRPDALMILLGPRDDAPSPGPLLADRAK